VAFAVRKEMGKGSMNLFEQAALDLME